MLKKIIWSALVCTSMGVCISCQTGNKNNTPERIKSDKPVSLDAEGLASAANRKAMIAELGNNYQKSAQGQYQKRITTIAPFKIQLVGGQTYTYKSLVPDKAVVLVYFSPSCDECQRFTKALVKRLEELKDKQFVFITYEELDSVKAFYKKNALDKYPQIKMGTEGYRFTVQKYYKVQHFPFVASYDKTGHLTKIYANNTQPEQLAARI